MNSNIGLDFVVFCSRKEFRVLRVNREAVEKMFVNKFETVEITFQ